MPAQQTFLGSSIRNYTCSLGWKGEISKLTVNLADDVSNGDVFAPPTPGNTEFFQYDSFQFGGLVQSYRTINDFNGYPVYEVTLIDPREILDGVQLILEDYNGDTTSIPNLYNIYAYWENDSYGSSLVNDSGMPWYKIRDAFDDLVITKPIELMNSTFRIAWSLLPVLPDDYRIGGGFSISLMEFITKVCEDAGHDFFFTLAQQDGFNYITLVTASRILAPVTGKISEYISTNTANTAVSSDYGLEMRNEVTSKFVVGGSKAAIYLQTPVNGDLDTLVDDTIMQFWGTNEDGTPIIGYLTQDQIDDIEADANEDNAVNAANYSFNIPSRFINVYGVDDTYPADVMEMRAALGGQAGWETYLWSKNGDDTSPHYQKPNRIGILSNLRTDLKDVLTSDFTSEAKFRALDLRNLAPLNGKLLNQQGQFLTDKEENVKILFDYVSNYANEFYGKKFMVRIPFVYAALEPDTNIIRTSVEPCEGGYLSEAEKLNAINNGYLPPDMFNLTLEDGRIETYVKFNYAQDLDLSDIPPDCISMDFKQNDYDENLIAYIKCTVDPTIYYLDTTTLYSPRVVVTLPGRVVPKTKADDGNDFNGVLKAILSDHARTDLGITNQTTIDSIIDGIFNRFGGEQLMYGLAGLAQKPDLVGVALQSNIDTYGPWYAAGAIGKIVTVKEPSLVPWNYNGYEVMDAVGNAMVTDSITYQQVGETGTIEVPGSPALNLGDQLLSGGPYITDISVGISEGGVKTTYRMQTWTPRFGRLNKSFIDRIDKISGRVQQQKRLLQQLTRVPPPGSKAFDARATAFTSNTGRRDHKTSSTFLAGETFVDASGFKSSNVVVSPTYDLPLTLNSGNYPLKALVSLDGIFRPFSTNPSVSGIAHFETPTASGSSGRSVTELNPYQNGTDISLFARSQSLPPDSGFLTDIPNTNDNRAMALRGPIILSGWGYDTNGKPVPNSNPATPTDSFTTNYLKKCDEWKTGPVDLQWDNSRKVWSVGGGAFRVAKLTQNLVGNSFASGIFMTPVLPSGSSNIITWTENSGAVRFYDGFEYSYPSIPSGARIYVQKEQTSNEWFVFAAGIF